MSSSTRKRGRPLQQTKNSSPATPSDPDQSSASKKRKLKATAAPSGIFSNFVKKFLPGRSTASDENENIEDLDGGKGIDDAEEDELAADVSDNDDDGTAKLTTKSSPSTKALALPPSAKRRSGRPRKKSSGDGADVNKTEMANAAVAVQEEEAQVLKVPKKLQRIKKYALRDERRNSGSATGGKETSLDADPLPGGKDRPNGGKRQHILRSRELEEADAAPPKSILTAPKPQRGRPKKNVEFEIGEAKNLDLGFKDIPDPAASKKRKALSSKNIDDVRDRTSEKQSVSKKSAKPVEKRPAKAPLKQPVEEDSESEAEEDDVPCSLCQGKDSEEPNEIVFCESCDLAVHQECYGIPVIPEDDWFCQDCLPKEKTREKEGDDEEEEEEDAEDEDGATEEKEEEEEGDDDELGLDIDDESNAVPVQKQVLGIENFEHHLQVMQSLVLQKLSGQRRIKLRGLDEEFKKVYQVVEQTVLAGESNSMLVIGARGSGKTTLIETVLSDLSTEHREDFHIVRLNGFIHTDDKLALREIWRQLGREMELDEELTGKTTNHADTLASLLALLSHPSELSETDPSQTSKSVIFILDEFDLFATHPRQTLLYNLFDIAQARKAPIAVLGLTTRIDVVEALEKRVKSRFSHRYVHLSLPKNLSAFWDICREGLVADEEQIEALDPEVDIDGWSKFQSYWNKMLEDLYIKDDPFKHHLQTHFYRTKSIPSFLTTCLLPLATLTPSTVPLTGTSFLNSPATLTLLPPDSKLHLIPHLPTLPLTLLITAARLDIIHSTETCNFAMAYDEYTTLATRHKIQNSNTNTNTSATSFGMSISVTGNTKIWGREVALGAWERLIECGFLVSVGGGGGGGAGAGGDGKATRMWRVDVGLEEIGGCVEGMGEVFRRWCREI